MKIRAIIFMLILCWLTAAEGSDGFDKMFFEFEAIKGDPGEFHEIFTLGNAEIHVVSNRELFGHAIARDPANNYGGYTVKDLRKYPILEVWVIGKRVDGLIMINWAILGHEISHVLNFENPRIKSPDEN